MGFNSNKVNLEIIWEVLQFYTLPPSSPFFLCVQSLGVVSHCHDPADCSVPGFPLLKTDVLLVLVSAVICYHKHMFIISQLRRWVGRDWLLQEALGGIGSLWFLAPGDLCIPWACGPSFHFKAPSTHCLELSVPPNPCSVVSAPFMTVASCLPLL